LGSVNSAIRWWANSGISIHRTINDGRDETIVIAGIDSSDQVGFMAPLTLDSSAPTRLAFGTYRVYLTDDSGDHWRAVSRI
jgi:hypothetical protein